MKIVAFDDEVPVGGPFFEAPSGVDRMNYRQAKSTAGSRTRAASRRAAGISSIS
jgi:hypothetical protein